MFVLRKLQIKEFIPKIIITLNKWFTCLSILQNLFNIGIIHNRRAPSVPRTIVGMNQNQP
jgi:hypothetical protein